MWCCGNSAAAAEGARVAISSHMTPSHWGGINGVSEELGAARRSAARCAASETDPGLQADYAAALAWVEAQIAHDRQRHEEDEAE